MNSNLGNDINNDLIAEEEIVEVIEVEVLDFPDVIVSSLMMMPNIGYKNGLLKVSINNDTPKDKNIIIKAEIQGVSEEAFVTQKVTSRTTEVIEIKPTITKASFREINQIQDVSVSISVTADGNLVYANTKTSKITANDVVVWRGYQDYISVDYEKTILGWVTPSTSTMEAVLSNAKSKLSSGSFNGYQTKPKNNIIKLTSTIVCCGEDAFGGAPDPYVRISGNGLSYATYTNSDNRSSTQAWNTNFTFPIAGVYNYYIYDEDILDNDLMTKGTITIPASFFEDNPDVLDIEKGGTTIFSFEADWKYHSDTQVKAIYEELKSRNLSYVSSSEIAFGIAGEYFGQKVRFPDSTIASTNFNCIDGVVLFASLMESVGIDPIIVMVPGHSYIGWYRDADKTKMNFLETTLLRSSSFEQALSSGNANYATDKDLSTTSLIDVKVERRQGYIPLS